MPAEKLEIPGAKGDTDWSVLYRARGEEVVAARPVFTGDVFANIEVGSTGEAQTRTVAILQHPCALRVNGVDLTPTLLVAEVAPHKAVPWAEWSGSYKLMPLPGLTPGSPNEHHAISFIQLSVVTKRREPTAASVGIPQQSRHRAYVAISGRHC